MTLVSLLVLAGQVASGQARTVAVRPGSVAAGAAVSPARTMADPFEGARPELWRELLKGPFRLARAPQPGGGAGRESSDTPQAEDAPSHAVCTIRIISVGPAVDPGFVMALPPGPIDPIVRDDLSPCAERR